MVVGQLFGGTDLGGARDMGGQYSPLDTAACVNNMAVEFRKLGMLNEAAESFARAMSIKERELGPHRKLQSLDAQKKETATRQSIAWPECRQSRDPFRAVGAID